MIKVPGTLKVFVRSSVALALEVLQLCLGLQGAGTGGSDRLDGGIEVAITSQHDPGRHQASTAGATPTMYRHTLTIIKQGLALSLSRLPIGVKRFSGQGLILHRQMEPFKAGRLDRYRRLPCSGWLG